MAFYTVPPNPRKLPRRHLLWPPVLSAVLALFLWIGEIAGHPWNIHTDMIPELFLLSLIVGPMVSIATLSSVLPALQRYTFLRTKLNFLCTGIALAYLLLVVFMIGTVAML